ncbi:MAG: HRDC domain-containing protein [Acidobacteriota bacterium]
MSASGAVIGDASALEHLVDELRSVGRFAIDLEFVSESRYVPELCLVQVGWGEVEDPRVAAVDPLAVDVGSLAQLVADPAVEKVLHAGQADLALLGQRFAVRGRNVFDTQIAAAFVGVGDQIGYGPLVGRLLDLELDKGAQFTHWDRRPLAAEQLRYALDDVRYLPRLHRELVRRLEGRQRLAWVAEESKRLAETAATRPAPGDRFLKVKGWDRLRPPALGALRALAAWREEQALERNTPPQWILQDRVLLEIARRLPKSTRDLGAMRGIKDGLVRRHGSALVEILQSGAGNPPSLPKRPKPLSDRGKVWSAMASAIVQALARKAGVAPRFLAARDDLESLVRWYLSGNDVEPEIPLLQGWRRELAGAAVCDWLAGGSAIIASEQGIELVSRR